jgi:hypothetical protein
MCSSDFNAVSPNPALVEFRISNSSNGGTIIHGMLRVVIMKPSGYGMTGHVERFRRGFMPNSTMPYIRSMTPPSLDGVDIETHAIDEYVQTDLRYLDLLRWPDTPTLLPLVGVQSHQFQRAIDLSAFARANGVQHCVRSVAHAPQR